MAENNSSAPLKTAGEPFVALGECIADQVCLSVAELPDRDSPADWPQAMLVTNDELRNIVLNAINYAARAVEAQAEPAAVAVPDERAAFEDFYLAEARMHVAHSDTWTREQLCDAILIPLEDGDYGSHAASVAWKSWQARAATPVLPATEDSSAGDLAEAQAEPVACALDDGELEDLAHAANQEALSFGVSLDPFLRLAKTVRAKCAAPQAQRAFQQRVQPWMMNCFGAEHAADRKKRNQHFLEEALELVQSTGWTQSEAHQLVDYVYGRPAGDPAQEVGGVMVTLAALCLANHLDMHACGETELARIWSNVDNIRARQAAKPSFSPLPQAQPADALDDTKLLNFLRDECCDLRCDSYPSGGDDSEVYWKVIEHHMAKPHEREIGRSYSDEPRQAIRAAMAAAQESGKA